MHENGLKVVESGLKFVLTTSFQKNKIILENEKKSHFFEDSPEPDIISTHDGWNQREYFTNCPYIPKDT